MKKFFKIILTVIIAAVCIGACKKESDPISPDVRTVTGTDWILDIVIEVTDSLDSYNTSIVHFMSIGLTFDTDSTVVMSCYMYNPDSGSVDYTTPTVQEVELYKYDHPDIYIYEDPNTTDATDESVKAGSEDPREEDDIMHLRFYGSNENFIEFVNGKDMFGSQDAEDAVNIVSDFIFRKITVVKRQ